MQTNHSIIIGDSRKMLIKKTFIRTKSVVNDSLAPLFPDVRFEEPDLESEFISDIDYLGWVGDKAFGIQIKPMTNKANFGNYKPSERMQASFTDFEKQYGGKVFIVYSLDGEIGNEDVISLVKANIIEMEKCSRCWSSLSDNNS